MIATHDNPPDSATIDRARLERQLGRPLPDLTRDERSALLEVLTAGETSDLLAWIAGFAPEMFDAALAARGRGFADEVRARPGEADEDYGDEVDGDQVDGDDLAGDQVDGDEPLAHSGA